MIVIAAAYVATLGAIDAGHGIAARAFEIAATLPAMVAASLAAYGLRYWRWRGLLSRLGHDVFGTRPLLAYVAGFAFTASPGKVGELVRIRYYATLGIPHADVIACFVFERVVDLLVLAVLAAFISGEGIGFAVAGLFVALVVAAVCAIAHADALRRRLQFELRRRGRARLARGVRSLLRGIALTRRFWPLAISIPAFAIGLAAWAAQCLGYSAVLLILGHHLPWWALISVPPAAILIGAASMMPGGIGTTEAATVLLLTHFGSELDQSVLAAVAMRVGSIWFSTLLGLAAVAVLESRRWTWPRRAGAGV